MILIEPHWEPLSSGGFVSGVMGWTDDSPQPVFFPLRRGQEISWVVSGPRRCIGTRDKDGTLVRCPENSTTRRGMTRCGPCQALDEMRPCILCDGSECRANEERRAKCNATRYIVYLAIFGGSLMKVGVSSANRLVTRWVEQGADMAGILGEVIGGQRARQIEDRIARSGLFTKAVRGPTKGRLLSTTIDMNEATRLVHSSLTEDFARRYLFNQGVTVPLWPPSLIDLSSYYGLQRLDPRTYFISTSSLRRERIRIVGQVVGMKGPLLLLSLGASSIMLDIHSLIGYTLTDDSRDAHTVIQSALSDFL